MLGNSLCMSQTVVTPKRRLCGKAVGLAESQWTWQSIRPGRTVCPGLEIVVPVHEIGELETWEILPFSIRTEPESMVVWPSKMRTSVSRKDAIVFDDEKEVVI
jgi:hypothetical protein